MPSLVSGVLDQGYYAIGIQGPSSDEAGDRSYWYGITAKNMSKTGVFYCVYRATKPDGTDARLKWVTPIADQHRGELHEESGSLVVTVTRGTGDQKPVDRYVLVGVGYVARVDPKVAQLMQTVAQQATQIQQLQQQVTGLSNQPSGLTENQLDAINRLVTMIGL